MDTSHPATPVQHISRIARALPDAVTAGFFLLLWIAPGLLPEGALRTGLLMLLLELVLLHATGMIGVKWSADPKKRRMRWMSLLGMGALYFGFVALWCRQFDVWWPLFAFAWLLVSKAMLLMQPIPSAERRARMKSDTGIAIMLYIGAVVVGTSISLPQLGLDSATVEAANLPGGGVWVDTPQTLVAAGLLYFGMLAIVRFFDWQLPATWLPKKADER